MGAIRAGDSKLKLMSGDNKVKRAYAGDVLIYSTGNTVTYNVDGSLYQEEIEEGQSCLSPTFAIPPKSGYTFAGWSKSSGGTVLSSCIMGDEPILLYAIWKAVAFTLTLTASGWSGPKIINGGFKSGPTLRSNPYGDGVEVYGIGATELPWACGGFCKTIDTRGLAKATITVRSGSYGRVDIGSAVTEFTGSQTSATISIGSAVSQLLTIAVFNGGDTYNQKSIIVTSIRFHE